MTTELIEVNVIFHFVNGESFIYFTMLKRGSNQDKPGMLEFITKVQNQLDVNIWTYGGLDPLGGVGGGGTHKKLSGVVLLGYESSCIFPDHNFTTLFFQIKC